MSESSKELERIIAEAQKKLREMKRTEDTRNNSRLVGRCFAYQNCYSCPKGPEDYWLLYARVSGVTEAGNVVLHTFEKDKDGAFFFRAVERFDMSGWEEIAFEEFKARAVLTLNYVSKLLLG